MMRLLRWLAVVSILACTGMAQVSPALHSRAGLPDSTHAASASSAAMGIEKGFSTLPADASGEYELDSDGSVVQITIEQGRLTGYVTKMDHEAALTLNFVRSTVEGERISFSTRTVHGLSYSFAGTIVRGDEAVPSKNGFYRMVGEWTAHRDADVETESVRLKSTPRSED
jgi:hypothetical protein